MHIFGKDIVFRETDRDTIDDVLRGYHVPPCYIDPLTVLDLGCNIGLTILHYRMLWPNASIVGVELDEENVKLARQNTNTKIIHAAVAAVDGTRGYDPSAAPFAFRMDTGDRQVQTITLPTLIDICGGYIDFVKIDIEGAEFEILTNEIDLTMINHILIEVHNQNKVDKIQTILQHHGFKTTKHTAHWSAIWATK